MLGFSSLAELAVGAIRNVELFGDATPAAAHLIGKRRASNISARARSAALTAKPSQRAA